MDVRKRNLFAFQWYFTQFNLVLCQHLVVHSTGFKISCSKSISLRCWMRTRQSWRGGPSLRRGSSFTGARKLILIMLLGPSRLLYPKPRSSKWSWFFYSWAAMTCLGVLSLLWICGIVHRESSHDLSVLGANRSNKKWLYTVWIVLENCTSKKTDMPIRTDHCTWSMIVLWVLISGPGSVWNDYLWLPCSHSCKD